MDKVSRRNPEVSSLETLTSTVLASPGSLNQPTGATEATGFDRRRTKEASRFGASDDKRAPIGTMNPFAKSSFNGSPNTWEKNRRNPQKALPILFLDTVESFTQNRGDEKVKRFCFEEANRKSQLEKQTEDQFCCRRCELRRNNRRFDPTRSKHLLFPLPLVLPGSLGLPLKALGPRSHDPKPPMRTERSQASAALPEEAAVPRHGLGQRQRLGPVEGALGASARREPWGIPRLMRRNLHHSCLVRYFQGNRIMPGLLNGGAKRQNQWYHFGVVAPHILVWGLGCSLGVRDFDPCPNGFRPSTL